MVRGESLREHDAPITRSSVAEPNGYAEALTVALSSPVPPPHLQSRLGAPPTSRKSSAGTLGGCPLRQQGRAVTGAALFAAHIARFFPRGMKGPSLPPLRPATGRLSTDAQQ